MQYLPVYHVRPQSLAQPYDPADTMAIPYISSEYAIPSYAAIKPPL